MRLPRALKNTTETPASKAPAKPDDRELVAQRDRLLQKFTVMQADLGGAFYEMAIRDHVRLDVLTRKAAELQRVDAELTAAERALDVKRSGAAGHCPNCGSPFAHGVHFCAQCGKSLTQIEAPAATPKAAAIPAPSFPPAPPSEAPTEEEPVAPPTEAAP